MKTRPTTKILIDGGDPQETTDTKQLLGFVDGQTTNPTLIAKNPHIKQLLASGHKLSEREGAGRIQENCAANLSSRRRCRPFHRSFRGLYNHHAA
jgi:transaldolase